MKYDLTCDMIQSLFSKQAAEDSSGKISFPTKNILRSSCSSHWWSEAKPSINDVESSQISPHNGGIITATYIKKPNEKKNTHTKTQGVKYLYCHLGDLQNCHMCDFGSIVKSDHPSTCYLTKHIYPFKIQTVKMLTWNQTCNSNHCEKT